MNKLQLWEVKKLFQTQKAKKRFNVNSYIH